MTELRRLHAEGGLAPDGGTPVVRAPLARLGKALGDIPLVWRLWALVPVFPILVAGVVMGVVQPKQQQRQAMAQQLSALPEAEPVAVVSPAQARLTAMREAADSWVSTVVTDREALLMVGQWLDSAGKQGITLKLSGLDEVAVAPQGMNVRQVQIGLSGQGKFADVASWLQGWEQSHPACAAVAVDVRRGAVALNAWEVRLGMVCFIQAATERQE